MSSNLYQSIQQLPVGRPEYQLTFKLYFNGVQSQISCFSDLTFSRSGSSRTKQTKRSANSDGAKLQKEIPDFGMLKLCDLAVESSKGLVRAEAKSWRPGVVKYRYGTFTWLPETSSLAPTSILSS